MLDLIPTADQIIEFLNKNTMAFIATVDRDAPCVRGIMTYKTSTDGIIFTTGKNKDFYKQLKANDAIELCFYNNDIQIRVSGRAVEHDENLELKKEIVAARPFMQPWIDAAGYDIIALFIVVDCKAIVYRANMPLSRKRVISLSE